MYTLNMEAQNCLYRQPHLWSHVYGICSSFIAVELFSVNEKSWNIFVRDAIITKMCVIKK